VPFKDERISFAEWASLKASIPSKALPVVEIEGEGVFSQSIALARWAGKLSDLYPSDPIEALRVDEVCDIAQELLTKTPQSSDPEEKKRLREEYAGAAMKDKVSFLSTRVQGPFVLGAKISIADIVLHYFLLEMLRSGSFDYVAADYCDAYPALAALEKAVADSPIIKEYST